MSVFYDSGGGFATCALHPGCAERRTERRAEKRPKSNRPPLNKQRTNNDPNPPTQVAADLSGMGPGALHIRAELRYRSLVQPAGVIGVTDVTGVTDPFVPIPVEGLVAEQKAAWQPRVGGCLDLICFTARTDGPRIVRRRERSRG